MLTFLSKCYATMQCLMSLTLFPGLFQVSSLLRDASIGSNLINLVVVKLQLLTIDPVSIFFIYILIELLPLLCYIIFWRRPSGFLHGNCDTDVKLVVPLILGYL